MLYIFLLLGLFIAVTMVAKQTSMLRDTVRNMKMFQEAAIIQDIARPRAPYSLARTQLVFWSVVVIASYLYLYLNNGYTVPVLDEVNLILLSISMGTTITGKVIDDTQATPVRHQDSPSQGFLIDILSDENGISVHRLQNVVWNLIVAVIYIRTVFVTEQLPDQQIISHQLLALMGISAGAYVGIKATENIKPSPSQPAPVSTSAESVSISIEKYDNATEVDITPVG